MSDVLITGAAMIPMGRHRDSSYAGLAAPAVAGAMESAGASAADIEAVFCGHAFGGMLTAQRIGKDIGLGGIPMENIDNACSGGATALHAAVNAIQAGRHDIVLVIGVDKLTQFGGGTLPLVTEDWEVRQGLVMPALYAMRATRFLHDRGATNQDLAAVSVKSRVHSSGNPYAQYRKQVTADEVLASRPIADPLTLLQCCPTGDGAAALIVTSAAGRARLGNPAAIAVRASILHSGEFRAGFRDMLHPDITYHSAHDAFEQAGISPSDLDVVELHDAFTIAELVYYEALGLCPEGDSVKLLRSGDTTLGGRTVVNPSGGLLAKGHPVGCSGVAQVVEMFWQLNGQADGRQVDDARLGLSHVTGGGISGMDHGACTVHIFEKVA